MHECLTSRKVIKTTAEDAMQDLKVYKMMFEQYDRQQAEMH